MKKYVILILIYTSIIYSQEKQSSVLQSDSVDTSESNFLVFLGIRDEFLMMSVNVDNNYKNVFFSPFSIHVVEGVNLWEYYKIFFKFGILTASNQLPNDFHIGYDWGIFFHTNLFKSNFYSVIGYDFMYSSGEDGGHGSGVLEPTSNNAGINSYCIGLGYETPTNFSIDIMYHIPNKKVFGYDEYPHAFTPATYYNKFVYGIINIGFQYTFLRN